MLLPDPGLPHKTILCGRDVFVNPRQIVKYILEETVNSSEVFATNFDLYVFAEDGSVLYRDRIYISLRTNISLKGRRNVLGKLFKFMTIQFD